jgi:hypothetical protein
VSIGIYDDPITLRWVKVKAIVVTGREDPYGWETSRLPYFVQTVGSQMAVRLSALRVGRPLPHR